MGEWEDSWGMHDSGVSIGTSPCWNDDWEHELRDEGYRTIQEWNERGHVVNKGEKGTVLPCPRLIVFSESQTHYSSAVARYAKENARLEAERSLKVSQCAAQKNLRHFESFNAAAEWAKQYSGRFSRCPDCDAFINGEEQLNRKDQRRSKRRDFGSPKPS